MRQIKGLCARSDGWKRNGRQQGIGTEKNRDASARANNAPHLSAWMQPSANIMARAACGLRHSKKKNKKKLTEAHVAHIRAQRERLHEAEPGEHLTGCDDCKNVRHPQIG